VQTLRSFLRTVGSLWFAAVLLVLLLIAMACATTYETTTSAAQALAVYYRAWWFEGLLALLALNTTAALIVRYPFSRRLLGFVITHVSMLVILVGAFITKHAAFDGRVIVAEGQTVTDMINVDRETLTATRPRDQARATVTLPPGIFGGFSPVAQPPAPPLQLGDVVVTIQHYLPDSAWVRRIVPDTNPRHPPAVEVTVTTPAGQASVWLLAGRSEPLADRAISFRHITDVAEWNELLASSRPGAADTEVVVRAVVAGTTFDFPLADCLNQPVPVGRTGYSLRVLRYLTHAVVAGRGQIIDDPTRSANPVIEVEINAPDHTETRYAFANFPDFRHGGQDIRELEIVLLARAADQPGTPVQIFQDPADGLHIRFDTGNGAGPPQELEIAVPREAPWPDTAYAVLRHLPHARTDRLLEQIHPPRAQREPAILVTVTSAGQSSPYWLQKNHAVPVAIGSTQLELTYANERVPLGFALTLDAFNLGYYPGGRSPRSYESLITLVDPGSGRARKAVVTMNRPVTHGGYEFFQSSYSMETGQTYSYLSVAHDPGRPIVYFGYITLLAGMLILLATRIAARYRAAARPTPAGGPA
jgi:hypothetical protein